MRKETFAGSSVFLSRSLVAPEVFDAVHDALRLNGAQVLLCCDPSRNSPSDHHVISSADHEKFEDLRAKGCNLIGPQCILYCAKEKRNLPKQGYTCCLAMEGVQVLASGFEKDEKVWIEKMVRSMGGILNTKTALDINFVVVKNVLAAKYKWALNVLKKPIVNLNWLHQCGVEHRIVPHELYRILPFTGLTICVTKIRTDERKDMEQLIRQNGGNYSADLTKKCTHLISDAPGGDKYTVARRWGHILIVSRRWIDQSISRRACLDERYYLVNDASVTSNGTKCSKKVLHDQSQTSEAVMPVEDVELTETSLCQNMASTYPDPSKINSQEADVSILKKNDDNDFVCQIAEDSESDDNDLYLSNCRIALLGFDERELSKLVILIRKGGGSRHMSLSEKLTHIVIGAPSENEKREVRHLAAWGVINVVKPAWLLECDQFKREIPVSPRLVVPELLGPRDSLCSRVEPPANVCVDDGKSLGSFETESLLGKRRGSELHESNLKDSCFALFSKSRQPASDGRHEKQLETSIENVKSKSANVFNGKAFSFSCSFPINRRAEIIEWIRQGGGFMMDNKGSYIEHFLIEDHGSFRVSTDITHYIVVSPHWIRFCLEEGCMQDIRNHVLFSPLSCRVPLPGFEKLRICISQYEDKDRMLLRNLCHTLGAKFTETLTKKVTHLLCKYRDGRKYEAACKWSIGLATADWISECAKQDSMVPLDAFQPRQVTAQDIEAGLCTSQYPTHGAGVCSAYDLSELQNESQRHLGFQDVDKVNNSNNVIKVSKLSEKDNCHNADDRNLLPQDRRVYHDGAPDVAEAIEDLLAQSRKMQDMKSHGTSSCDQSIFSAQHAILEPNRTGPQSSFEFSRPWLNSGNQKEDSNPGPSGRDAIGNIGAYDAFSETQTESQVVGYEEDLSGRQKIIDRVRSQSMASTPDK